MISPGNDTSVTRTHVHDLYTRHAHTKNYTATPKSHIGKFPIISYNPYNT